MCNSGVWTSRGTKSFNSPQLIGQVLHSFAILLEVWATVCQTQWMSLCVRRWDSCCLQELLRVSPPLSDWSLLSHCYDLKLFKVELHWCIFNTVRSILWNTFTDCSCFPAVTLGSWNGRRVGWDVLIVAIWIMHRWRVDTMPLFSNLWAVPPLRLEPVRSAFAWKT